MTAPRWVNHRLDLGPLGYLEDTIGIGEWGWSWWLGDRLLHHDHVDYPDAGHKQREASSAAQRAAVRWLRAALKQAAKRLEVK